MERLRLVHLFAVTFIMTEQTVTIITLPGIFTEIFKFPHSSTFGAQPVMSNILIFKKILAPFFFCESPQVSNTWICQCSIMKLHNSNEFSKLVQHLKQKHSQELKPIHNQRTAIEISTMPSLLYFCNVIDVSNWWGYVDYCLWPFC